VILYLQHLIRASDMMFDEEYIHSTFCGTNLPGNAVCCCYHPALADDGSTANVSSATLQWYLEFKYAYQL